MHENSPISADPTIERHFTVTEIAERWNLSDSAVRRMFFDEPGVLKFGTGSGLMGGRQKKMKRRYFNLRIPESVFVLVRDRLTTTRRATEPYRPKALPEPGSSHPRLPVFNPNKPRPVNSLRMG